MCKILILAEDHFKEGYASSLKGNGHDPVVTSSQKKFLEHLKDMDAGVASIDPNCLEDKEPLKQLNNKPNIELIVTARTQEARNRIVRQQREDGCLDKSFWEWENFQSLPKKIVSVAAGT